MVLKRCEMIKQERFGLCLMALKLMFCYGQVSDSFGFNPQGDRENILKGMQQVVEKIKSSSYAVSHETEGSK